MNLNCYFNYFTYIRFSMRGAFVFIFFLLIQQVSIVTAKEVIDLKSTSAWLLQIDGKGEWFRVKVPFGGWNSDFQFRRLDENKDVTDFVIYKRQVTVPSNIQNKVIKLHFGAVNFGAEIYVNDILVGKHHSVFTAFDIDISDYVKAGDTFELKVKSYVLNHYKNDKGKYDMPTGYIYDNKLVKFPFGIARKIELHLYPCVYISDIFVKPSVVLQKLEYDISICNSSAKDMNIILRSNLSEWNENKSFKYPIIKDVSKTLKAKSITNISVSVPWTLGLDSYWWPNIPFNKDYLATLHYLNLAIVSNNKIIDNLKQRFGFVEHSEGPFYYMINGVRVNVPSDASAVTQGCVYDGYTESIAYQYTKDNNSGCKATWKKYMALGIRANRTHQEPPTQNILDAADEVGFLIIPETAIRGSHLPQSNDPNNPYYRQHITDMVRECRNHPSVARYSLSNELHAVPEYLDMALPVDDTRPYVFETNTHDKTTRVVGKYGHAYVMTHYVDFPKPTNGIYGLGEYAWATNGIDEFASQAKLMRINDICYYSGWSWTNYWPNFLEGWNHGTYAWKQNNHPDRVDGVDGWNSPIIKYVQNSLNPFLILDKDIELKNHFTSDWPSVTAYYSPGDTIKRTIMAFNDDLFGDSLDIEWDFCWDSPNGKVLGAGAKKMKIKPGFHKTEMLCISIPNDCLIKQQRRKVYLNLRSIKNGKVVFKNSLYYWITNEKQINELYFLGVDSLTQGSWKGVYGTEGYDIAGADCKLPGYIQLNYTPDEIFCWGDKIDDKRALQRFINDGNTSVTRIASAHSRYGTVTMTVDVGNQYRQLAIYFLDWNTNYEMPIYIPETEQKFTVKDFKNGKYLLFKIKGRITFIVGNERQSNIAGVFFDRPK